MAKDGITLDVTNRYGQGLIEVVRANLAPRVGAALEITPKFVVRGGVGLFFNSFENQGYGPNIGENYPFVYNLQYGIQSNPAGHSIDSQVAPVSYNSPYAGCATAGPGGTASFESGFSCIPLTPSAVNALGLELEGLQFDYQTPHTLETNLTLQYAITRSLTAQAAYVYTHGANLQGLPGMAERYADSACRYQHQELRQIRRIPGSTYGSGSCVPFPGFRQWLGRDLRPEQLQRSPDEDRGAVLPQCDLPVYLHLREGVVGRRRPAEWRVYRRLAGILHSRVSVPGSITAWRTTTFVRSCTSVADISSPSGKASST